MNMESHTHNFRSISFGLSDTLMGVNILDIREIVPAGKITKVPGSPEFVMGLINFRGQILTILDIAVLLGLGETRIHSDTHVIVFKYKDAGFAVDSIGDVIEINPDSVESVPASMDSGIRDFLSGIAEIDDGVLMILDAEKLLAACVLDAGISGRS